MKKILFILAGMLIAVSSAYADDVYSFPPTPPGGTNVEDAAYGAITRALTAYLGDKFNLPAAGLTRDVIWQRLAMCPVPEHLIDRLLTCLDWADSGRFAPAAAGRDARDLAAEAEKIITELEGRMPR